MSEEPEEKKTPTFPVINGIEISETDEYTLKVRRAPFSELAVYEISEYELEVLERGSPDSVKLNFSLALLSIAITSTLTLLTTPIPSGKVFQAWFTVTSFGYIIGIYLLVIWLFGNSRQSAKALAKKIRERMPVDKND
jgi:hypothetical protein